MQQGLPVMEHFYTVQGEGTFTGSAAYFIRLGGCDVGCTWCDVKESWDVNAHPKIAVEELVRVVTESGALIAVITGGEPAMHDLTELTRALKTSGIRTHIETSGVYPLSGAWDWVTFSPKKFKKPHDSIFNHADELKVVVYHPSDLNWAETFAPSMKDQSHFFLQPEWSRRDKNTPLIFDYVRQNPRWRISIQTHKYMGVD
jgi:organic radical activating enzyme